MNKEKTLQSNFGKNTKLHNLLLIIVPIVLSLLMAIYLTNIYNYNHTKRSELLDPAHYDSETKEYIFDDISVKIDVRGGDSGSWLKDPIYDDNGEMLHGASVGTIYEALIYNTSKDIVSDWKLTVPINELMWVNNNWNSKMEIHQDVNGNHGGERVLAIDLSDYSEYDINLDYYIDHTGPMIPLYVGDYFTYLPEQIAEEKPINPAKTGEIGEACARFGYIMYIPDQGIDYIADFSGGNIEYYMYANPFHKIPFWILASLIFIWFIVLLITLIVRRNVKLILNQQKREKEHDRIMVEQTMKLIINTIENKDPSTKGHSIRVAEYSRLLANKLGYDEDECQLIYYIGLLHDCGKINIPDRILKFPGKLSQEDYEIMKKHTTYGAEILKDFTSITGIDVGAKYHHERFDGKGYPSGISEYEIPEVARIIGVADAFDAMNSQRCYRDKLPKEVIISELDKNRNKQFDSKIVDCLMELIDKKEINF